MKISGKIVSGLKFLHQFDPQILHLDLKPGNVLLSHNLEYVKLADFCLSKNSGAFTPCPGGTFKFMSPELLMDKIAVPESDIYSFGCILYNLCTYFPPWNDLKFHGICEKFSRKETPKIEVDYIPMEIKEIIEKCLRFLPNERPSVINLYDIMMMIM